ncbi:MAG: hypothetical protein ACNI27_07965 [Desulfovibrio sp.]
MTSLDKYAEALSTEMLGEAATNFFGARVDIENRIKRLQDMADELNEIADEITEKSSLLRHCLLDNKNMEALCLKVGCNQSVCKNLTKLLAEKPICFPEKVNFPFGFTEKKRFKRLILKGYEDFYKACKHYHFGSYYDDEENPGRKKLTINYSLLVELTEYINEGIQKINKEAPAGEVLHYVKGICAAGDRKSDICGGVDSDFCSTLDKSLEMEPFDFDTLAIFELPLPPAPDDIKDAINEFSSAFYDGNKREVRKALSELK